MERIGPMASTPERSIALVAMFGIAVLAVWFVLVSWLGWEGVYENNEDQGDAGLYFVASLVGLCATIAAIAGLGEARARSRS
jgi:hypothetical protein